MANATPSELLAAFFDYLRANGTELPVSNRNLARMLAFGIENVELDVVFDVPEEDAEFLGNLEIAREALRIDLEVVADHLT